MNGAHYHLLVNHVSLFGTVFGLFLFIWGTIRKSNDVLWAAVALFVIAAAFGWIAVETGEMAQDVVKQHFPEVSKAMMHDHEEAGEAANILCNILAASSLLYLWIAKYRQKWTKLLRIAVIALAIVTTGLMARAANMGGIITHSEIR